MSNGHSRIPGSYDEILRRTVVDPDGSFRPSQCQEDQADESFRGDRESAQMTGADQMLYARLAGALLDEQLGEVGFEVDRGVVTLHGSVRDAAAINALEDRARAIEGVERVVNQLVVRA